MFGPAAIGVVLTGNLDDGTAGLWTIKKLGGITIVQDPSEALFSSMPLHALEHVQIDHVLPLSRIAALLVKLTAEPPAAPEPVDQYESQSLDVDAMCAADAATTWRLSVRDADATSSPAHAREALLATWPSLLGVEIRPFEFLNYYTFAYPLAQPGQLSASAQLRASNSSTVPMPLGTPCSAGLLGKPPDEAFIEMMPLALLWLILKSISPLGGRWMQV